MRRFSNILSLILVLVILSLSSAGQGITLKQSEVSGLYKRGQKISVTACLRDSKGDSLFIRVLKNNLTELVKKAVRVEVDTLVLFQGSFDDPCTVIVEARIKETSSALGFAVDPLKIKPGAKCPDDFKKYWDTQRKILHDMPLDVKTSNALNVETKPGFSCFDIEINCPGPKPARGYYAKPQNSKPKSLPAVLLVHAAGVKGSWCRSEPENALKYARQGAICFDLNAHGMLNGQPESYYADLETGELKMYFFQGLTSRDDIYFRGMYLRLMRAIEFLARQPEWDGRRILVIGESQGGGQALAAAGLDKRVSAVVALVPAMCDWMGPLANHEGGWPQPLKADVSKDEMMKAIPYFDDANILRGSKAAIFVEIGLIDVTCPAASVYAAVNQSKGKKLIHAVPYRAHHQPQNEYTKTWEETVYKPREEFISNFFNTRH